VDNDLQTRTGNARAWGLVLVIGFAGANKLIAAVAADARLFELK
jgi:hypothetical protein